MKYYLSLLLFLLISLLLGSIEPARAEISLVLGPESVPCFGLYEAALRVDPPPAGNPFDASVSAVFSYTNGPAVHVEGFCDDPRGALYRVRFCPSRPDTEYRYSISISLDPPLRFEGAFRTTSEIGFEPVVVNPEHPKHFQTAYSKKPFFHMGFTAYHLLDPSNSDVQIEGVLDYCVEHGFNKIRFLLTGYPRDTDTRSSDDYEYGVDDQWKEPNYGAPPGEVNPLPAWEGRPHAYDFTRFHIPFWQKVDRAVAAARNRGIVATCILTIEKQDLPQEYGALTGHEKRLYRYAAARLAAFSNVWWDLGNEHIEFRPPEWAPRMGAWMKEWDPYGRLVSAHGYKEWNYDNQPWADFIITQQYGTCFEVNQWALGYAAIPKPYVNEEYGYEGHLDQAGHGQNTDWVRKCHWAIALAGGYATYGDWTAGTPFYTGHAGQGKAPAQLKHLRAMFETLPYPEMLPANDRVDNNALCLALAGSVYLVYLPEGGETPLRAEAGNYTITWIDPRAGERSAPLDSQGGLLHLISPSPTDWAALVQKK